MLFDIIYRNRTLILSITCLAILFATLGIARLEISTDNRIFYGHDNPYHRDYLRFESEFTANDNIIFVLSSPLSLTETAVYPEAVRWLSDRAWGLDHVLRIDSLANYPHPHSEDGTLIVAPILDWACPDGEPCAPTINSALSSAGLINRLVNEDQTATGVVATVLVERGAVGEIEALNTQVAELAEQFNREFPSFDIYYTGGVPMMAAFASATANDLQVLLPLALAVVSLLLVLVLGSIKLSAAIVLLGLLSTTTTLGLAGWTGHTLNNATSIVPLIVFTLVVTSSMHIAVHFSRNITINTDRQKAIGQARASLSSSVVPIVISAITSAVSLASLWFVDSPPIQQLGIISAVGVLIGLYLTLFLFPLTLVTIRRVSETRLGTIIQSIVNSHARQQENGRDRIVPATLVLILAVSGLPLLEINDDFVRFFDESVPFRHNTDRATELLAGPNHIEVVLRNDNGSVFDPAFLSHLAALTDSLRGKSIVANAHSFSDVMEQIAVAFTEQPLAAIDSADELAQLYLIYELSLQLGQSNTDLINANQSAARVSVLLKESTSVEIQSLEEQIYRWHSNSNSPFKLVVTGENIPVAHLSWMNIKSMLTGIFISLSFTALVIGTYFRSYRLGLVTLLATVLPVLAGFGAWAWINNEIGLAATAIIALTIGVVVDDAAHYIYRFLDARQRLHLDAASSAAYAIHRAGAAIVSTSIVMGLGLSLLLLSKFQVNGNFGAVATIILGTALIFDLAILPRLTIWAVPQRSTSTEPFA